MEMKVLITHHLVKEEDLNHHKSLYAGRCVDWMVESSFIAAASLTHADNIVCLKIHGMLFLRSVFLGALLRFESRVVYAGKTSLIVYTRVLFEQTNEFIVDGYLTFVHVDPSTSKAVPHGLIINAQTEEEKQWQNKAIADLKA